MNFLFLASPLIMIKKHLKTLARIGEWDIVYEENLYSKFPGKYEGLEKFGYLSRYVMYANPNGKTYCVFQIPNSHKYVFSIMNPFNHFNPVTKEKIPNILLNHIKKAHVL